MKRILCKLVHKSLGLQITLLLVWPMTLWGNSIWDSHSTLSAQLQADFSSLFAKVGSLPIEPGRQSSKAPEAYVNGYLRFSDPATGHEMSLPIRLRVRGGKSKRVCLFPKLELEFTSDAYKATIFAGNRSIKIGTHCEHVQYMSNNHLAGQVAPHREALVYRMEEILGLPALKARPALMTYLDTGKSGFIKTRQALFLESTGPYRKRRGVKEIFMKDSDEYARAVREGKAPGEFIDAFESANPNEILSALFFCIAIGDSDHIVPNYLGLNQRDFMDRLIDAAPNYLYNMKAFVRADGSKYLLPVDFGEASLVANLQMLPLVEVLSWFFNQDYVKQRPEAVKWVLNQLVARGDELKAALNEADLNYPDENTGAMVPDSFGQGQLAKALDRLLTFAQERLRPCAAKLVKKSAAAPNR